MPIRTITLLALCCLLPLDARASQATDAPADTAASTLSTTAAPANASAHQQCDAHADELFGALDAADYAGATTHFDTALRTRYPSDKLRQDYEALPQTYGKLLGRGRPHTGDVNGHTLVLIPLIFERGTLTAEVHCGQDSAVSDFKLAPTQVMSTP